MASVRSLPVILAKLPLRVAYITRKLRQNYAPFYLQKHPTKPSFWVTNITCICWLVVYDYMRCSKAKFMHLSYWSKCKSLINLSKLLQTCLQWLTYCLCRIIFRVQSRHNYRVCCQYLCAIVFGVMWRFRKCNWIVCINLSILLQTWLQWPTYSLSPVIFRVQSRHN